MSLEGPIRRNAGTLRRLNQSPGSASDSSYQPDPSEPSEREYLTGGLGSAATRKSDAAGLPPHPSADVRDGQRSKHGKFKAVSQLVVAMNRFKASINPTYTFGKRPPSRSGSESSIASMSSRRDTHEEDLPKVPQTHGHKTAYLLSKLPPAPMELPDEKHDI